MGQTTSDRTDDPFDERGRSAQFRQDGTERGAEAPTVTGMDRRADFEPAEPGSDPRGVLEQFREELLVEASLRSDETGESAAALQAALITEERLGSHGQARRRIRGLGNLRRPTLGDRRLYRRLLRARSDRGPLLGSLERSVRESDEPEAALLALEGATEAWRSGADPENILPWLERTRSGGTDGLGCWSRYRLAELEIDTELELGRRERARKALRRAADELEEAGLTELMELRLAIYAHLRGRPAGAAERLRELRGERPLPGDLDDLLAFLCFEEGDLEFARELYRDVESRLLDRRCKSVPAALGAWSEAPESRSAGLRALREAAEEHPGDETLLRVREMLLDARLQKGGSNADPDALIDVLNGRLELADTDRDRVAILTRLGELYEGVDGLEEAAADVYREALDLKPDHATALRALGRLYARRENWSALAELYEHELAHLDFAGRRWRHHFRIAELYERKLDLPETALAHYRRTLDERPHYLPALKAVARILTGLERWTELADLFLSTVEDAPTRRQRLYLLDRAAEVAERRLDQPEVAIGAWEEILEIEEDYPRAFASLGRLYAETERWEDLLELNVREIGRVDDEEEVASLYLRNAEICERHLDDLDRAEEFYRRALTLVPEFLPALEGLGRLYARRDDWEAIVRMTERELREMEPGPEVVRQLEALAEIVERELDRPERAAAIYEKIDDGSPGEGRSRHALRRLRRRGGEWERVISMLEEEAAERTGADRAERLGQAGLLEEWFHGRRSRAYDLYCAALDDDPENRHWLEGIARTWSDSAEGPEEAAARLEEKVVEPLEPELLDRYFQIIARLRERAEETSEASRAYRLHGDPESRENQAVLQFAMAATGEREALTDARRTHPHHELEELAQMGRSDLGERERALLEEYRDEIDDTQRRVLAGELPAEVGASLVEEDEPADLLLLRDLGRICGGEKLEDRPAAGEASGFSLERLRATIAEREGKYRTFKRWTYDELASRRRRDVVVRRLVRLSAMARHTDEPGQAAHVNRQAAIVVFPALGGEEDEVHPSVRLDELEGEVEEGTIELLYESLRASEQWELFRECLRAHVGREGLSDEDRVALFTELAAVCEDLLEDLEGAIRAVTHSWQIAERPEQLCELVRLDRKAGRIDRAVDHQRRHYRVVLESETCEGDEVVESGLRLARLLSGTGELREGIGILEDLRESFPEAEKRDRVLRRLAHAYVEADEPVRAVETFREFVTIEVNEENLEDWRELVRLHDEELDDPNTAYELQWRIVEAFPREGRALERLVQLAHRDGRTEECVTRLEARAEDESGDERLALLTRAARVAQEELQLWEEADRLFERVTECAEEGSDAELDALRRRVLCIARLTGREEESREVFERLLDRDPYEPSAFRAMLQMYERERAFERARMTRQALTALNCEVEEPDVRTKTTPARSFDDADVEAHLLPEGLDPDLFHLLRQTMPLAEKVCGDELPQKKVLDGRKLRDDAMAGALEDAMAAFETSRYYAEVGDNGPPEPQVFGSGTPEIWLNDRLVDEFGSAEAHFTAGYVAALGWSGLAPALELDGRRLWHLVEGTWLRQKGEGFEERVDVESQRMSEQLGSPFLAVARRRLVRAAEPVVDELPDAACEFWPDAVEEFAARAGLVVCGDLAAAARCLLRFRGWDLDLDEPETREQITRIDLVGRLMRFAFSEDYLEARYAVGLSGRPSEGDHF